LKRTLKIENGKEHNKQLTIKAKKQKERSKGFDATKPRNEHIYPFNNPKNNEKFHLVQ
jgi:hypothetical protein